MSSPDFNHRYFPMQQRVFPVVITSIMFLNALFVLVLGFLRVALTTRFDFGHFPPKNRHPFSLFFWKCGFGHWHPYTFSPPNKKLFSTLLFGTKWTLREGPWAILPHVHICTGFFNALFRFWNSFLSSLSIELPLINHWSSSIELLQIPAFQKQLLHSSSFSTASAIKYFSNMCLRAFRFLTLLLFWRWGSCDFA